MWHYTTNQISVDLGIHPIQTELLYQLQEKNSREAKLKPLWLDVLKSIVQIADSHSLVNFSAPDPGKTLKLVGRGFSAVFHRWTVFELVEYPNRIHRASFQSSLLSSRKSWMQFVAIKNWGNTGPLFVGARTPYV